MRVRFKLAYMDVCTRTCVCTYVHDHTYAPKYVFMNTKPTDSSQLQHADTFDNHVHAYAHVGPDAYSCVRHTCTIQE
jgi:hypothetical protein